MRPRRWRQWLAVFAPGTALIATGCQDARMGHDPADQMASASQRGQRSKATIRRVPCLYDQRPWLNLDATGDRDPEGFYFRTFLDPGTGRGVLADGTFHVEMYIVERDAQGQLQRRLASDWHYPTSQINTITSPILGRGYLIQLRWASKDTAGKEIEVITRFEDPAGNVVRAGTKRLRVPKYSS